eukprot:gene623-1207_t
MVFPRISAVQFSFLLLFKTVRGNDSVNSLVEIINAYDSSETTGGSVATNFDMGETIIHAESITNEVEYSEYTNSQPSEIALNNSNHMDSNIKYNLFNIYAVSGLDAQALSEVVVLLGFFLTLLVVIFVVTSQKVKKHHGTKNREVVNHHSINSTPLNTRSYAVPIPLSIDRRNLHQLPIRLVSAENEFRISANILAQTALVPSIPWSGDGIVSGLDAEGNIPKDIFDSACVFSADQAAVTAKNNFYNNF